MKNIFAFLFLLAHTLPLFASETPSPQVFASANEALMQGNYEAAATQYRTLLEQGVDSAAVQYNLGIAHYRLGAVGKAIFHFRLAHQLRPRDADITFNLNFVRTHASDKIDRSKQGLLTSFVEHFPLSKKETLGLVLCFLVLASVASALLLYKSWESLRWLQRSALTLFFLGIVAAGLQWQGSEEFGVVVTSTADVYSGQGAGSVVLFSVHEGTEFTLKDRDRQWLRIVLADGKQGWVQEKQVLVTKSEES